MNICYLRQRVEYIVLNLVQKAFIVYWFDFSYKNYLIYTQFGMENSMKAECITAYTYIYIELNELAQFQLDWIRLNGVHNWLSRFLVNKHLPLLSSIMPNVRKNTIILPRSRCFFAILDTNKQFFNLSISSILALFLIVLNVKCIAV